MSSNLLETLVFILKPKAAAQEDNAIRIATRRASIRQTLKLKGSARRSTRLNFRSSVNVSALPDQSMVRYLHFKVSVLIRALLEMNETSKFVLQKLAKFLSLDLLMQNLYVIHKHYKSVQGETLTFQALNRHGIEHTSIELTKTGAAQSEVDAVSSSYCPVEAGFYLYMLMKELIFKSEFY